MTDTSNSLTDIQTEFGKIPVHLGNLSGPEGNAFSIMGQVKRNGRDLARAFPNRAPLIETVVDKCINEMMEGDYDHLLDTVLTYCTDLDGSIEALRESTNWDEEEDV